MYATVRRYTARKGSARALAADLQQTFLPVVSAIPGFVAYYYAEGDPEAGRDVLVTVTVCETRDGVEDSVRKAAAWVKEHAANIDVSAPMVTTGEVLASKVKTAAAYAR